MNLSTGIRTAVVTTEVMNPDSFTIYFAGDLFDAKHLSGNALLAETLTRVSGGRYRPLLPQDFEPRHASAHGIRDTDLHTLLECDLGVFHFDGSDLDSGTVVEFVYAKCADIPAVLLRTDFRKNGDQDVDPWNLMASFFPRTKTCVLNAHELYAAARDAVADEFPGDPAGQSLAGIEGLNEAIARELLLYCDAVIEEPAVLPAADAEVIYRWLATFPGFREGPERAWETIAPLLKRKRAKGLLGGTEAEA